MLVLLFTHAALCGGLQVSAEAGVSAETRGGYLADGPTTDLGADVELAPSLVVRGREPGVLDFAGEYAPAFLLKSRRSWDDPLVLHSLALDYGTASHRGDALRLHLSAISGPLDYTRAARTLGVDGELAAFPRGELVEYANADLVGAGMLRLSRRLTAGAEAAAGYTGPSLGTPADVVRRQARGMLQARVLYATSRRTMVGADAQVSAVYFETGPDYVGAAPALTLSTRLSRNQALSLRAGVQATRTLPDEAGAATTASWQAVGHLSLESLQPLSRRRQLVLEARAELSPFYDPFRATLVPRAVGTLGAELRSSRGPAVRLRGQWYEPLPGASGVSPGYDLREQRLAAGSLSTLLPLVAGVRLELGAVALQRWEADDTTAELEVLGFAALGASFELGRVEAAGGGEP